MIEFINNIYMLLLEVFYWIKFHAPFFRDNRLNFNQFSSWLQGQLL